MSHLFDYKPFPQHKMAKKLLFFSELKQNRNARKKRQVGSKGIFSTMKNSYRLEAALINDTLIAESILDSLPVLSNMSLAGTNTDETYINETLTESLKERKYPQLQRYL